MKKSLVVFVLALRLFYVAEFFREDGEILKLQGKTMEGQTNQKLKSLDQDEEPAR